MNPGLKTGPKLELMTVNRVGEHTDALMGLADKDLLIRTSQNLYCISAR